MIRIAVIIPVSLIKLMNRRSFNENLLLINHGSNETNTESGRTTNINTSPAMIPIGAYERRIDNGTKAPRVIKINGFIRWFNKLS